MRWWHWLMTIVVLTLVAVGIADVYSQELVSVAPATVTRVETHWDGDAISGYTIHTNRGSAFGYRDARVGDSVYITTYRGWLSTRKEVTR